MAVVFTVMICSPAMAGGHNNYRGGGYGGHNNYYGGGNHGGGGYNYYRHNNYGHGGGYYNSGRYYGEAIGVGIALGIAGAVIGSMVVPRQCWEEIRQIATYDQYGRFIGYVSQPVTVCR